jgi:hypothetical protein
MTDDYRSAMQRCVDACARCRHATLIAMAHGLNRGGYYAESTVIAALLDCAEMCTACTSFMLRESPMHPRMCDLCADVCDACAEICDGFRDDDMMRECTSACRLCATACGDMVRVTHAHERPPAGA